MCLTTPPPGIIRHERGGHLKLVDVLYADEHVIAIYAEASTPLPPAVFADTSGALAQAPHRPSSALVDGELEPGEEVALEPPAGLFEAVYGFLYEIDFVLAVGADLCMARRVFHEDNLVVEEAALEKGGAGAPG